MYGKSAMNGYVFLGSLMFFVVFFVTWDVFLGATQGPDATITAHIRAITRRHPGLPLLVGLASGLLLMHLFGVPNPPNPLPLVGNAAKEKPPEVTPPGADK